MKCAQVTVVLRNAGLSTATLLDANGMPVRELAVARAGEELTVTLPPDVLYVVLR
jgi:hypothetical protein